ncbi:disease resistance-like protein DSC1 isoform X1 [Cornus florida]|uniref:disease resistance-like protein DSC1 isoform X1 n=1 Tax=Cornus florida TaxID=4283 RepID=UPI002898464B|nr:disease resistance-like protein DSC1 isoform X1 [Cornus florida]
MDRLEILYLNKTAIKDLPSSIEDLKGLSSFTLWNCRKLRSVPSNIFSRMKDLRILDMGGIAIEQLPPSIVQLCNLSKLYLNDIQKSSLRTPKPLMPSCVRKRTLAPTYLQLELLSCLNTLSHLDLRNCNFSEESFPKDIGCLSCLERLDLRENKISSIPASLIQLKNLKRLDLVRCTSLRTLTSLPPSICYVNAHDCKSLERYWINPPSASSPNNREFKFTECHKLVMFQMDNMPNMLSQSQLQGLYHIILPGSEIPQWFRYKSEGEGSTSVLSLSVVVDHHHPSCYNNVKGIAICFALEFFGLYSLIQFDLKINGYGVSRWLENPESYCDGRWNGNHLFLMNVTEYYDGFSNDYQPFQNLVKWICDDAFHIEISAKLVDGESQEMKVKKMGIHLVMEEQDEG